MTKTIVTTVIIVIVILIGVYFFSGSQPADAPELSEFDVIEQVSTDDSVEALEQEVNDTNLENIDAELADIEAEIEGALAQ